MNRRDATLVRDIDSMHYIMPLMYPNRCDNEAFISEVIDLTNAVRWLEAKNAGNPEYRYNVFQMIVTAVLKTITLRPQLNRFYANYNLYQRYCPRFGTALSTSGACMGGRPAIPSPSFPCTWRPA